MRKGSTHKSIRGKLKAFIYFRHISQVVKGHLYVNTNISFRRIAIVNTSRIPQYRLTSMKKIWRVSH